MITRRELTGAALALPAVLGVARGARAQALARRQRVDFGLGYGDARSLDPHMTTSSSDIPVLPHVFDGLLNLDDSLTSGKPPKPGLAERWESSEDNKLWTFFLRRGVAWHGNHGEFSAEDAKYSIDRVRGTQLGSPFRQNYSLVEEVSTDGPHILRVRLREPNPDFPMLLVNYQTGYVVCKRAIEGGVDPARQPIGTGPFTFTALRPRESMSLARNPNYWGGAPTLEEIVFHFMAEGATRELALRSGDVLGIDIEARQDIVERLRRRGTLVDVSRSGSPYWLQINLTKKPFDDVRVRKALAHATNRDELIAFSGQDLTSPEFSAVPEGYSGYTGEVERYAYDVDRAKALLAEAGLPNGFTTESVVSNSVLYLPYMNIMREQWRKAGITVNFRVVDHPTFHRLIRQDASPLVIYAARRYPSTALSYLEQFYAGDASIGKPTAITNFARYGENGDGIDELLARVRASGSATERNALLAEAQRRISRDVPVIPLFSKKTPIARSPKLDLGAPLGDLPYYVFDGRTRVLA
jgi:peptide/nickel transport system substrate-binding protein